MTMTKTSETYLLDEVDLIADCQAAWDQIRHRSTACPYTVFVTEEGARAVPTGGDKHKRMMLAAAHGEVGTYNRRIEFSALVEDVFHVAQTKGFIA